MESTLPGEMVFRTRADALEPEVSASDAVKDAVGHMVRQFADPMAFLRELAQNSIDAGASAIDVRLRYDQDDESLVISVHDDGAGMNLETIERCLLVLFRSSKDKDPTKIGKFGVGFFSVFALGPSVVRVDTGTGPDGYRLELSPDFTYEVVESSARKGTTVTLLVKMRLGEARSFAERALTALERWCPHVEIALHMLSTVRGGEVDKRIDRPFGIEGPIVDVGERDGIQLAVTLASEGRAAFYKRGILLYECPNSFVSGVSFKVESSALVHTVSRDNVRRDGAFARVVLAVETAVRERFTPKAREWAAQALRETIAAHKARGPSLAESQERAAKALRALAQLSGESGELPLPLCEPDPESGEQVYVGDPQRLRCYADKPGALSLALAKTKVPVLWAECLGEPHASFLRSRLHANTVDAKSRYCAVAPRDGALPPFEADLLERVRKLLAAVDIPAARAVELEGVSSDALFLAVDTDVLARASRGGVAIDAADAHSKLYALFSNRACAINRGHPVWTQAVIAAEREPALAALTVARLVLIYTAKLDASRDRALFDALPSVS